MEELGSNLLQLINRTKSCEIEWENDIKLVQIKMKEILFGTGSSTNSSANLNSGASSSLAACAASPQQMKKRPKRLSAVIDKDEECNESQRLSLKSLASEIDAVINETTSVNEVIVVPKSEPQPEEHIFARPQRAAKLKADNFKEPSIHTKLRRPDTFNETTKKIKKENETRASQVVAKKSIRENKSQAQAGDKTISKDLSVSNVNKVVDESLLVVADKESPVVEIFSEEDDASSTSSVVSKKKSKKDSSKNAVIKIKKEKLSLSSAVDGNEQPQSTDLEELPTISDAASSNQQSVEITANVPITVLKNEIIPSGEETLQITTTTDSSTATDTTTTNNSKRTRKKKPFNHRPIKEERVSLELDSNGTPVSTRTRSSAAAAAAAAAASSSSQPRPTSVYEDAVDKMPQETEKQVTPKPSLSKTASSPAEAVVNETIATNNATMVTACDATFVTNQVNATMVMPPQTTFNLGNNPNATVTIATNETNKNPSAIDATFDVRTPQENNDSLMTEDEDESFEKPLPPPIKPKPGPQSSKILKPKTNQNELFNPCVQSPVKKKVQAFENHAQKSVSDMTLKTRSKKAKENSEPELPSIRELKSNSAMTPVIGKPHLHLYGKFLTPTQSSNITPNATQAKKLPNSASKAMPFPISKQNSASSLKCTSSASSQSLSRENSEDDIKKGFNKLQKLADERKKKRELKHQQAAQLREAKEKERAERLNKLVKEREEKNRKKALELEQKKRELEEINRNLKLQEEREQKLKAHAAAASSATKSKLDPTEIARQERELLDQMRKMPPPPKQTNLNTKYNFNMLHSDDSTDEEGKASYKRPKPPQWSRSSVRTEGIACQAYLSSDIIDSFFSVQPMTPDLKAIFPNIDARYLKRNSSAIWNTPPRYSEMPKY